MVTNRVDLEAVADENHQELVELEGVLRRQEELDAAEAAAARGEGTGVVVGDGGDDLEEGEVSCGRVCGGGEGRRGGLYGSRVFRFDACEPMRCWNVSRRRRFTRLAGWVTGCLPVRVLYPAVFVRLSINK